MSGRSSRSTLMLTNSAFITVGRRLVLEALVGHDMAPVAGGIADRQQDRPARLPGLGQRRGSPWPPVHRIGLVLQQIGARLCSKTVLARILRRNICHRQTSSLHHPANNSVNGLGHPLVAGINPPVTNRPWFRLPTQSSRCHLAGHAPRSRWSGCPGRGQGRRSRFWVQVGQWPGARRGRLCAAPTARRSTTPWCCGFPGRPAPLAKMLPSFMSTAARRSSRRCLMRFRPSTVCVLRRRASSRGAALRTASSISPRSKVWQI